MDDDIVTRLRCIYVADGCGQCKFCLAKDEIERLAQSITTLHAQRVSFAMPL